MSIVSPNLDDKTFDELRAEALAIAKQRAKEWTDQSPHDPGVVLLELFAYLTETLLFRLNRLPRKVYIEFLKLIGLRLQPPAAASVDLTFATGGEAAGQRIQIPRGTRVTSTRSAGGEPVVFVTGQAAWVERGQSEVRVRAHHHEMIEAELVGQGSGAPGLVVRVSRPPIIAGVQGVDTLQVGVEVGPGETVEDADKVPFGGKTYRVWREVENFSLPSDGRFVYRVDRVLGTIAFAPALDDALGAAPAPGREIRVWYSRGGGAAGLVRAGTLDRLKDGNLPGIKSVRNDADATGGRDPESLEDALVRGPAELHSLKRAVTARDFESLVMRERGGIALVKAFAQRDLWRHARPGTVDVVLVPDVPAPERGAAHELVTAAKLREKQGAPELDRVQELIEERSTLGTTTLARYGQLKSVSITATVGISGPQDPAAVRARLQNAIYRALSPLDATGRLRRGFGDPLRVGDIYGLLQSEAGVAFLQDVSLRVDVVPEAINGLALDPNQPGTLYAGCSNGLFRTTNRGESWEQMLSGDEGAVERIAAHPSVPGVVAIVTRKPGEPHRIRLTRSAGESWSTDTQSMDGITDIGWTMRDASPVLLVTSSTGLYESRVKVTEGPTPGLAFESTLISVQVDAGRRTGFWALATGTDVRGTQFAAVAAIEAPFGIYLSATAGATNTFKEIGLRNENVRVLELQRLESATFLWAGTNQPGHEDGKGCFRRETNGTATPDRPWDPVSEGWNGSSVNALAFNGSQVFAASYQRGVMVADTKASPVRWRSSDLGSGLPEDQIDTGRYFHPLLAIAAEPPAGAGDPLLFMGGAKGLFRRERRAQDAGVRDAYVLAAPREVEQVLVPRDWLICSGEHAVLDANESGTD